jgi:hypothetical protein
LVRRITMNSLCKGCPGKLFRILFLALAASLAATGQTPTSSTKQLTEDQAQALLKKISSAPPTTRPLTAADLQQLLAYLNSRPAQPAANAEVSTAATASHSKAQRAKAIRIGVVLPQADLGPGAQGAAVAEPLRQMISHYLSGPVTELLTLDALVPQQIDAEAQAKNCDYVLYSAVSQRKAGGNGMGLFKGATTMANMLPMAGAARAAGGMLGAAGSVANAASSAQETASLSKGIKAKSEVSLEYKLQAVGNPAAVLSDTLKAKAATDGEDVMTPLVQKVAEAVVTQVTKQ